MTPSPQTAAPQLVIPAELKPADGRFGSGPSRVRSEIKSLSTSANSPNSATITLVCMSCFPSKRIASWA